LTHAATIRYAAASLAPVLAELSSLCRKLASQWSMPSSDFMPHGYCYLWDPQVVWLNVLSDALIALSYYAIPLILIYFIRRNRQLPFNAIFWMFGAFILACGSTHAMEIWNVWHGDYLLAGMLKGITAAVSVLTAAMLVPLVPRALALSGLQAANLKLEGELTERHRSHAAMEQALKDLADQKFALDQHAIVATTDVQGTITYVNQKFCEISQYSPQELIGKNHRILNSGHHPSQFFQHMYRTIANGKVWRADICNRAKDGSLYWVDTTVVPFLDPHGKPRQYMAIRADITARKQAEEVRERLAAVVESSDDAIIGKDLHGTITSWNRGAEKVFGYTSSEALGKPMTILFPPEQVDDERAILQSIARGHSVEHYEAVRIRKDGRRIDVSVTISPIRDSTGVIVGASKVTRDVTERKRSQQALEESETNFRALANLVPQFVWICTSAGLNEYFNDRWFRYTGLTPEQSHGNGWSTPFHPEDAPAAWQAWSHATATGETYSVESRLRAADGSYRWFLLRGEPVLDGQGRIAKWFGTCTDIEEMRRAQAALRESDTRREFALLTAGIGDWELDLVTRKASRSLLHARIFGYESPQAEWNFEIFLNHVHPQDRERVRSQFQGSVDRGERSEFECRIIRPNGDIRWIWACSDQNRNFPGQATTKVFGIVQDITTRKQAEAALRESEERFQTIANGIPQLAWMTDAEGNIFWYNQRWYEYTGTTLEQMQGWGWKSVHDPEILPKVMERWIASIASGEPFDMEFPLRGADGRFRMFLNRSMPVRDESGRVVRWLGTNTDISDIKLTEARMAAQAEELSRQSEEVLRSRTALETQTLMLKLVLENIGEGLVAADQHGRFLLWNNPASKLLRQDAADLPPDRWSSHYRCYLPDGTTLCPTEQLPLVRALHGESFLAELIIRREGDQPDAILEFSGHPMNDAEGNLCGGVVAFRDITQRKLDELEIRRLTEGLEARVAQRTLELQAANRELESFTYSVSHDLRAPLRHIAGFSRILVEDFASELSPQARKHLSRIEDGTRRMGQLVDELLNLARVGRHALKLQPTDVKAVVEDVISLLQPETEGRKIAWTIAALPQAHCDPVLVRQIFQNLIANALKFTRPRECAVIALESWREEEKLVFAVRDNGVGFDMKYADKLFGVFQRLHRVEDFEGTGIGLATVHRIVQKHGGRIWAESQIGQGTTFFFTLDAAASVSPEHETGDRRIATGASS
jgi:PAS domain S-box-containing protein